MQVKTLLDVQDTSAVLRGTAAHPDITLKVTASDRADLPWLLTALQTRVAANLSTALGTPLQRLGVQLEIDTHKTNRRRITVKPPIEYEKG